MLTITMTIGLILCIGCGNAARKSASPAPGTAGCFGPGPATAHRWQRTSPSALPSCLSLQRKRSLLSRQGCGFGAYFNRRLIAARERFPERIRLFERSRLDAITREKRPVAYRAYQPGRGPKNRRIGADRLYTDRDLYKTGVVRRGKRPDTRRGNG